MTILKRIFQAGWALAASNILVAETISVTVDAAQNDGTMSSWWKPSAFATWSGGQAINDLVNDANGKSLGMVRLAVEQELSSSTSLSSYVANLNNSDLAARIQNVKDHGGIVVLTIARMPAWLSSGSNTSSAGGSGWTIYNTMPPASQTGWAAVVQATVNFFNVTKGFRDIMYYECWNEPDSDGFWRGTETQFEQMYASFASGALAGDPSYPSSVRVGGPTAVGPQAYWQGTTTQIVSSFLSYCQTNHVRLDFVSFHFLNSPSPIETFYRMREAIHDMDTFGFGSLPVMIDEHTAQDWVFNDPSWPTPKPAGGRHADTEVGAAFALSFLKYVDLLGQPGWQGESLDNHDHPSNSAFPADQFSSRRTNVLYAQGIRKAGYWAYLLPTRMSENKVKVTSITESNSANEYFPHFHAVATKTGDTLYLLLWNYVGVPFRDAASVLTDRGYSEAQIYAFGASNAQLSQLRNYWEDTTNTVAAPTSVAQERTDLAVAKTHYQRQKALVNENHTVALNLANFTTNSGTNYQLTRYEIDSDSSNSYAHYLAAGGDGALAAATAAASAHQNLEIVDRRQFTSLTSLGTLAFKPYMATLLVLERNVAAAGIFAPVTAQIGQAGLTASVTVQSGATYEWRIQGGKITGGQGTAQITFSADGVPEVVLQLVTRISSSETATTAVVRVMGGGPTAPVTVNAGGGDGSYPANTIVAIVADPPAAGQIFDRWTGDTSALADPTSAETFLTVPARAVTVTASYRSAPGWTSTRVTSFNSSGASLEYYIPPSPRGLIFNFHGAGGNGNAWFTKVQYREWLNDAVSSGYGVVALDSVDRVNRQWSNTFSLTANPDMVNLVAAIQRFTADGLISSQTPLYFMGHSNGGAMAPRAAALLASASPAYPVGAAASSCASVTTAIANATTVPQFWLLQSLDSTIGTSGNADATTNFTGMLSRGVVAQMAVARPVPVTAERIAALSVIYPGYTKDDAATAFAALKSNGYLDANGYVARLPATVAEFTSALPAAQSAYATDVNDQLRVCFGEHEFNASARRRVLAFFAAPTSTYSPSATAKSRAVLLNLSARAATGGSDILIAGLVVSEAPSTILLRGVGPTLNDFGVSGSLSRTNLLFYQGATVLDSNIGWETASNAEDLARTAATVGAFPLASQRGDSALLKTVNPGAYTVHVLPADSQPGVALIEVYSANASPVSGKLVNLSVRATAGTGSSTLIAGLVVGGEGTRTFLIRAVGPGLTAYGVGDALGDPRLQVYSGPTTLARCDDWSSMINAPEIRSVSAGVGAFALSEGSHDAAVLVSLAPGAYTVHVVGDDNSTGTALVEIYSVP